MTGAVLTNQDKTGLSCRGDDLGYFSKATFWLLAELVPRRMLKVPFWESFKPRDNWLGCGVAGDHTGMCSRRVTFRLRGCHQVALLHLAAALLW